MQYLLTKPAKAEDQKAINSEINRETTQEKSKHEKDVAAPRRRKHGTRKALIDIEDVAHFRTSIERHTTKKEDDLESFEFEYDEDEDEEEVEQKTPWWVTRDMAESIGREAVLVSTLRAFIIFAIFLTALVLCAVNRRHSSRYHFYIALREQFVREQFETYNDKSVMFQDIRTPEDFWMYSQTVLLKSWHWDYYYWNDPDDPDSPVTEVEPDDRKLLYENLMMGVPRIRQVKIRNDSCEIPVYFRPLFSGCYYRYSQNEEEKTAFGKMTGTAWTYNTPEETNSLRFYGNIDTYEGGGYYLDLTKDMNSTRELLKDLYDNLWIDEGTRAIFIDWSVYNANLNLFCLIKLVFEFPATGGIIPSDVFVPVFLDVGFRSYNYVPFVTEGIVYVMGVYYFFEEFREMWFFKCRYFKQFWTYMDLSLIALIIANLFTSVIFFPDVNQIVEEIVSNPNTYGNMEYIGWMKRLNDTVCSSMMFLGFLKIFKYLTLNKRMGQLNNILKKSVGDIFCFTIMFLIIFFAYAQLGYLLFGDCAEDYRDIGTALISLLRCILGEFDYEAIEKTNNILAPVFILSYIFLFFFVLMNMFLAIINDTYADVKTEIAISKHELTLTEYMRNRLRKCGLSKVDTKETHSRLVLGQIRHAFEKFGFSEQEIGEFMTKYGNPDNDTRRMVKELEARANATTRIDDSVFVRLVDFVAHERLNEIEEKTDKLISQFQGPMARIGRLERRMKTARRNRHLNRNVLNVLPRN